MSISRRLDRIEAQFTALDTPAWSEVDAALERQTARIRLVMGARLGTPADHFAMTHARAMLGEDTREREAADLEVIDRWRRVHPTPTPPGDARQRLLDKIEEIASRVAARQAPLTRGEHISPEVAPQIATMSRTSLLEAITTGSAPFLARRCPRPAFAW